MTNDLRHITVLLGEAVDSLALDASGCYVDGTFGRGGHSRAILGHLDNKGRVLGFDKDPAACEAGGLLEKQDPRFSMICGSFAVMEQEIQKRDLAGRIQGVLFDFGVSSPQLDDATRGFSFLNDGPLDMRMNPNAGLSAAQWLSQADEAEIARIFREYGEERFAGRMAKAIVRRREEKPFERTADLAEVIAAANPAWEKGRHPATRAFQGIRIWINNELEEIERGLQAALNVLAVGGRLVAISFHSLEDRIVKRFMQRQAKGERDQLPRYIPVQSQVFQPLLRILGKPVYPSADEVAGNPRARSAVMRVAEKLR